MFSFAKTTDYVLMIIGTIATIASGAALPLMALFWGEMINNFNGADRTGFDDLALETLLIFIYIGIGQFIVSAIMIGCWLYAGERQAI